MKWSICVEEGTKRLVPGRGGSEIFDSYEECLIECETQNTISMFKNKLSTHPNAKYATLSERGWIELWEYEPKLYKGDWQDKGFSQYVFDTKGIRVFLGKMPNLYKVTHKIEI